MAMNITCPVGAYDPNVEPSKEDVLFDDPVGLLLFLESFFESTYGSLRYSGLEERIPAHPGRTQLPGFDVLLAHRPESRILGDPRDTAPSSSRSPNSVQYNPTVTSSASLALNKSMGTRDLLPLERANSLLPEESSPFPVTPQSSRKTNPPAMDCDDEDDSDREEMMRDVALNNPWIMAKLNTLSNPRQGHSTRNQNKPLRGSTGGSKKQRTLIPSPERSSSPILDFSGDHPMPGPPLRPFSRKETRKPNGASNQSNPQSVGLDNWIDRSSGSGFLSSSTSNRETSSLWKDRTPSSPILMTDSTGSFTTASDMLNQRYEAGPSSIGGKRSFQPELSQFVEHLDYENRKRAATLAARFEKIEANKKSSSGIPPANNSPHLNRRNAASAALSSTPVTEPWEKPLGRSQGVSNSIPRKKKGSLPMEKIEPSLATYTIEQVLSPTAENLKEVVVTFSKIDTYLVTGDVQEAFTEIFDMNRLEVGLGRVLSPWENDGTGPSIDSKAVCSKVQQHIQSFA